MIKLIHVITISDDYIIADCFSLESIEKSFIIFIKNKNNTYLKNKTYEINLEYIDTINIINNYKKINFNAYSMYENDITLYNVTYIKEYIDNKGQINTFLNKQINFNLSKIHINSHDVDKFIIFNSGEGLFSALCDNDNDPVIAYDMGCTPYHLKNDFGKLFKINLNKLKTIIISHRHYDHYNYFLRFYKKLAHCNLIINKNFLNSNSITIRNILNLFKNIYFVDDSYTINNKNILLTLFTTNIQNDDAHENNLCLQIKCNDKNILMVSDNYLDSINKNVFDDVNYLCASHHGGKFYKKNIESIPINNNSGILMVNTSGQHYNHPDFIEYYILKGWNKILYSFDGNIVINLDEN